MNIICIGLGYGDEGKGSVADWLVRETDSKLVVRFNGGPQAAHNVITPDGRHHTFAQFGSGTFVPGVKTFLSKYMLVAPDNLLREEEHLQSVGVTDALDRLAISTSARVITPYQVVANRLREELRQKDGTAHGTTGHGIGECVDDSLHGVQLTFGDLRHKGLVRDRLAEIRHRNTRKFPADLWHRFMNIDIETWLDRCRVVLDRVYPVQDDGAFLRPENWDGPIIFEGAQGVLLDEKYGWQPHVTWSNTTPANAFSLLREAGVDTSREAGEVHVIGVVRSYMTRHGAGPFVTEDPSLKPRLAHVLEHNDDKSSMAGEFRLGHCDLVATRYAHDACVAEGTRVDSIALTHSGVIDPVDVCVGYTTTGDDEESAFHGPGLDASLATKLSPVYDTCSESELIDMITTVIAPVSLISRGPRATDKVALRRFSTSNQKVNA